MEFLECLPEECLKCLTSLESLQIAGCPRLSSLSLGMRHLSNLVHLYIGYCAELDLSKDESGNILDFQGLESLRSMRICDLPKLASLPRWLLQASNLERLSLESCEQLDLSKDESGNIILDFHGGLLNLRSVDLIELPKLASLPRWILPARNLEHLFIRKCSELDLSKGESGNILDFHGLHQSLRFVHIQRLPKLASLPQWLLQRSNLERLHISHCFNLKELPEQIGALQSLQWLVIYRCFLLTSLPEGMARLASLTRLEIVDCPSLEALPEQIGALQSLQWLEIGCHKLTSLPKGMGRLASLTHLKILSCPSLEALPQQIEALRSLQQLEIDSCLKLTSLHEGMGRLASFTHLKISRCFKFEALPERIEALRSLQRLEIIDCILLTSLPEGMRRLASLTHLTIQDCPELEERCERDAGEDWYKVAHIPHVRIGL